MSTNFQKTPLVQNLTGMARAQADDSTWAQGKSFPCIVEEVLGPGIVTVNFQLSTAVFTLHNITMPVAKPPYVQYPIQKGDKGLAMSADVALAAMSGLGGGTPNPQSPTGNLSALYFVWLGNNKEVFVNPGAVTLLEPTGNANLQVAASGVTVEGPNGNLSTAGNLSAGTGATGSFSTPTGQTVMVVNGIVVGIY